MQSFNVPVNLGPVNVSQNLTVNVTGPQFVGNDLVGALFIVLVFALLIGIVYMYELYQAYAQTKIILEPKEKKELIMQLSTNIETITKSLDKEKKPALSAEDQKSITDITALIKSLTDSEATGIIGFTRGQIAISVIFILGAAVILIFFSSSQNPTILSNVLSMLGATLAAVVGFYFGTKKEGQ